MSKKTRKYISNFDEIRENVKKVNLPKEFKLSVSETITDVPIFIESHLKYLETDKLVGFHRPYYTRLKKVLNTLKIKIIITEE